MDNYPFKVHQELYVTSGLTFRNSAMLITLHLCAVFGSQNKQYLLPYTSLTDWFITEADSVYCAVRHESLYKTHTFSP